MRNGWRSLSPETVFFFQAEDGIRDLTVTGVQTCALPISGRRPRCARGLHSGFRRRTSASLRREWRKIQVDRSEERRVGKEGRSRWSPYHLKKKEDTLV